jgi:hypothetical protein
MKKVNLKKVEHSVKVGDTCNYIEPNVTEDSLFYDNDELVGFYIRDINKYSPKLGAFVNLANAELLSKRVPKATMKRSSGVLQFSTILGAIAPRPHMRRPYATISSVHSVTSAKTFVKAMSLAARESELLIKEIAPNIYDNQKELFKSIDDKWKFGKLFTSSISNYNIAAPYHRDTANLVGAVNVIICKRQNSKGGCTTIPDYGATVDSCDNSMLVYPAWRNVHGVTPIIPLADGGYRNTLVFYPLKAFLNE